MHGHDSRYGSASVGHLNDLARRDATQHGSCILTKLSNSYASHVAHCSTYQLECASCCLARRGTCHRTLVGMADDYGLTSTKPAALKSPSNAKASRIRRRRITAKLVASTNEYSRSDRARSQRHASTSVASSTWTTVTSVSAPSRSRKPTAAACPDRRRRRVHVSPTT